MNAVHSHKVGLTVGGMLAIWHAAWALLVLLGVAQSFMEWIFGLHFITMQFSINPFNAGTALTLIVVTGIIGYVMGYILGELWNLAHRKAHGGK